jgi:hypothetical protein
VQSNSTVVVVERSGMEGGLLYLVQQNIVYALECHVGNLLRSVT